MALVPVVLDLIGIFVFALSGALLAVRVQFDVVGVLVLGAVTGLGGGIMRDVLIGAIPPASFTDWRYLAVSLLAGIAAFRFHPSFAKIERYINWFDALGLGLFCVLGTVKALSFGLDSIPAALMGVLTAIGGGVLRDLLADRMPIVLRQDVYALPALCRVPRGGLHLGARAVPGLGARPRCRALHCAAVPGDPLPVVGPPRCRHPARLIPQRPTLARRP